MTWNSAPQDSLRCRACLSRTTATNGTGQAGTVGRTFSSRSSWRSCARSPAQDTAAQTAAVVKITAEEDGQRKTGAGFVVKTEADAAYIVTASHVVAGDKHPQVRFFADRTRASKAEAIALDEHMDVALIVVRGRGNFPRSLRAPADCGGQVAASRRRGDGARLSGRRGRLGHRESQCRWPQRHAVDPQWSHRGRQPPVDPSSKVAVSSP